MPLNENGDLTMADPHMGFKRSIAVRYRDECVRPWVEGQTSGPAKA